MPEPLEKCEYCNEPKEHLNNYNHPDFIRVPKICDDCWNDARPD